MSEFPPVLTLADFATLDESDVLIGYMDGFAGEPRPSSGCSRSYHHGWRNGMIDCGAAEPDREYALLAAQLGSVGASMAF